MFIFFQFIIFLGLCDEIFSMPDYIEKCRIDNENCLVRSSNKVLSKYYGGITEIDLQSLNPFEVAKAPIKHDFGAAQSDGTFYNLKAFGYSDATVQSFSGFDKNYLEIHFKMPKLSITGFYRATMTILGIQMKDEGSMALNFYDYSVKLIFKLERYTRNGKEYFRTTGSKIYADFKSGDVESAEISRTIIWTMNASFNLIFKSSFTSFIGDTWGTYYEQILNGVFNKVPIEDLFLK